MIQVDKFLCAFDLSLGGLIIGWGHMVLYFIAAILLMIFPWFTDKKSQAVAFIGAIVLLGIVGVLSFISYRLIEAIKTHDHKKMKPFLVTNLLFIVISLLDLIFYINSIWSKNVDPNRTGLDVTIGIIVRSILFAIIVYIFLTVRSLSMMVKTTDPPPPPPCDDTTAENEVTLTAVSSPSKEAETQIHLEPVQKY